MLIVGARGFAKEVLGVLDQLDSLDGLFFFDNVNLSEQLLFNRFEILHNYSDIEKLFLIDNRFTLGVGKPSLRHKLYHEFLNLQGRFTSVISPLANIAKFDVMIGEGVNIITGATIDCSVKIGKGCLLNTACIIGHDTVLEDFVEICPGATISGNCFIGERSFIGSNATVLPGIRIGANVTIGAGALVTKDIPENSLAYGNPAKPIL